MEINWLKYPTIAAFCFVTAFCSGSQGMDDPLNLTEEPSQSSKTLYSPRTKETKESEDRREPLKTVPMRLKISGETKNYFVYNNYTDVDGVSALGQGQSIYYFPSLGDRYAGHVGSQGQLNAYWTAPGVPRGRNPWIGGLAVDFLSGIIHSFPSQLSVEERIEKSISTYNDMNPMDFLKETKKHLSEKEGKKFEDADGLISFVNLTSSFVESAAEYKTGRILCDKVSNFFATLREGCYVAMKENPKLVPAGDEMPKTIWSPAVQHLMFIMLKKAGGLSNFKVNNLQYSKTMTNVEFSTEFISTLFDTMSVPSSIITACKNFIGNVGTTLRTNWDSQERKYEVAVLSQCHEAVPLDDTGLKFVYFPKITHYHVFLSSKNKELSVPCGSVKRVTFDFNYESTTTGLMSEALDINTSTYKNFVAFLDKAQGISYKEAENLLDEILVAKSDKPKKLLSVDGVTRISEIEALGVDLTTYPLVTVTPPPLPIETILNGITSHSSSSSSSSSFKESRKRKGVSSSSSSSSTSDSNKKIKE